jgi:hypothetical protein
VFGSRDASKLQDLTLHCKKLVDTQFPFPWAQAAAMTVFIIITIVSPFLAAAFAKSVLLASAVSFIGYHAFALPYLTCFRQC